MEVVWWGWVVFLEVGFIFLGLVFVILGQGGVFGELFVQVGQVFFVVVVYFCCDWGEGVDKGMEVGLQFF